MDNLDISTNDRAIIAFPLMPIASPTENNNEGDEEEYEGNERGEFIITQKESILDLTGKELATTAMLALASFCSTVAFSCIAPFYPNEAAEKGLTESQVGIVFGVFELTMFSTAPIFGKYMAIFGSKRMFVVGLLVTGVAAIIFGFLNYLPSGPLFIWASLFVRSLEAVGDAAFVTSSFAIAVKCFPGRITVVVGILETFVGLGQSAGPFIGGVLYEFGGFCTPFVVLGAFLFVAAALSAYLIENRDVTSKGEKGILAMLRIPVIWVMIFDIVICATSFSFLELTLAAHLGPFNLSPTRVGLMFILCGGFYTVSAPIWGHIIDRYNYSTAVMIFGSVGSVISMFLIGPAPFIPIPKNLFVIGVSLSILGVAGGAQYIPTFQGCLDAAILSGFENSCHTHGCVSGLFQAAYSFGAFIGPTAGGFAIEQIGFAMTATVVGLVHVLFILTVIVFHSSTRCFPRRN